MKKNYASQLQSLFFSVFFYLLYCLLSFLSVSVNAHAETSKSTIILPVIVDGPDFQLARQAIKLAYSKIGVRVNYVPKPPRRAIDEANAGLLDGETARVSDQEKNYPHLYRIDVPILYYVTSGITLKSDTQVPKNFDELSKVTSVGIISGIRHTKTLSGEHALRDMERIIQAFSTRDSQPGHL
jgi:hypothetical protein